jgi:hypothetical protein
MVKNLKVGMPSRIRVWVGPTVESVASKKGIFHLLAWDGVALSEEAIYLSGRTGRVGMSKFNKVSLIGHKTRRGKFFVEEVE